jgi:hypothetical protein
MMGFDVGHNWNKINIIDFCDTFLDIDFLDQKENQ